MKWQYTKNGLPTEAGSYFVAVHYFEHGVSEPAERIWKRYFDPDDPECLTRNFHPVEDGKAEIYAWLPVSQGRLRPPPYEQEQHHGGLTDDQLVRLLVCQSQGLDGYYGVCDKLPDSGGNDCTPFCPFGAPDTDFLNHTCGYEHARLKLMLLAAKRIAELTGNPLSDKITMPYGEE